MGLLNRITSPTPKFHKKLRNLGALLTFVSVSIVFFPMSLPATVVSIATYVGTVGATVTSISQLAKKDDNE